VICPRCKSENPDNSAFCNSCGKPLKNKQNKNKIGCLTFFVIAVIIVIAIAGGNKNSSTTSAGGSTQSTPQQKEGIKPEEFQNTVVEKLKEIDKDNLISKVESTVYGSTAIVKLYLNDLTTWSYTSDVEKKEFMNTMGKLTDSIASISAYPGTDTVGTGVILYSPGGMELAERTAFGNVKLK
jgi:predicted nucleic acid-binding Zn ribbon protein